jgi:hypothetical protein
MVSESNGIPSFFAACSSASIDPYASAVSNVR